MPETNLELATLIGSRLCHDLSNPLGAIANGVELLSLAGGGASSGPEAALLDEACQSAGARLRFFRIAFGAASTDQAMAAAELRSIFDDMAPGGRLSVDWRIDEPVPRPELRLAFLGYLCLETALPRGGRITVSRRDGTWALSAEAREVRLDPSLWNRFAAPTDPAPNVTPAQVQFPLLAALAAEAGRRVAVARDAGGLTLGV